MARRGVQTEAEWLASDNWEALVDGRGAQFTQRKLRLFVCACCRAAWHLLEHPGSRAAVEIAEQFADGAVTDTERRAAIRGASKTIDSAGPVGSKAYHAACAADDLINGPNLGLFDGSYLLATALQCDPPEPLPHAALLREIFGNPFRPVTFDPIWRTSDVMLLANGIYAERAFERMPILADALQDAGCDSDDILAHLRDANATHVRGCWALDLVLGKE